VTALQLYLSQTHIGELIMCAAGVHQLQYASSWLTDTEARPLSLQLMSEYINV